MPGKKNSHHLNLAFEGAQSVTARVAKEHVLFHVAGLRGRELVHGVTIEEF